jgi:uncharacterized protein YkwD
MVRTHRPRMRAGAATFAASIAVGLAFGMATTTSQASAMVMTSDRAGSSTWAARYNERLLTIVNNQRIAHGLRPVRSTPCASSWAHSWSSHLAQHDEFAHSDLGKLLDECHAYYASENLAMIYDGARPRDLVRLWMNSPGHRANILSGKARLSGVSIRWDPDQCAWIAVQNFVRK